MEASSTTRSHAGWETSADGPIPNPYHSMTPILAMWLQHNDKSRHAQALVVLLEARLQGSS